MGFIAEIFNFDNIGQKIKNIAKWNCWITILIVWIAAPITFFILAIEGSYSELCWIPLVAAIVVPILAWWSSCFMYAFGELVDNSAKTAGKSHKNTDVKKQAIITVKKANVSASAPINTAVAQPEITQNELKPESYFDVDCPNCGEALTFVEGTAEAECPWCNQNIKFK